MTDDNKSLRSTLDDLKTKTVSKGSRSKYGKIAAYVLGAASIGAGLFVAGSFLGQSDTVPASPTSAAQDFANDRPVNETISPPTVPDPITIQTTVYETAVDSATLDQLKSLEAALEKAKADAAIRENETTIEREQRLALELERDRFRDQLAALKSNAENDQARSKAAVQDLVAKFDKLSSDFRDSQDNLAAAQREAVASLANAEQSWNNERASMINDFERQMADARRVDPLEQEKLRIEAERLRLEAEDAKRLIALRETARAEQEARIKSGMIAGGNGAGDEEGKDARTLSRNESFVKRAIEEVPVATASIIGNPQATILQGTIIQASLETAVDSSLPGVLRAIVSDDVHSLDGSSVLIPAGSRVFGEYQSDIEVGQHRILIVWTRILTPSNRSVSIASYGADGLGRSGTEGKVDTRFFERFGNAAMISLIGAGPSIAASNTNNETAQNTIEDVGKGFSDATSNALGAVLSIGPRIFVKQGANITIILDRDVEIL